MPNLIRFAIVAMTLVITGCTTSPKVIIRNETPKAVTGYIQIPADGGVFPPPCTRQRFTVPAHDTAEFRRSDGDDVSMYAFVHVAWLTSGARWETARFDPKPTDEVVVTFSDGPRLDHSSHVVIEQQTFPDSGAMLAYLREKLN